MASYAGMIARHAYIPLALGLMIGPTIGYEVAVHEFPRTSITLRGLPLPWNGDAPLGSGPPIDVFIIPAIVDLAAYLAVCAYLWSRLSPRFQDKKGVLVPVVTVIWLYAASAMFVLSIGVFGFGGSWMLWYQSEYYESLLRISLSVGI